MQKFAYHVIYDYWLKSIADTPFLSDELALSNCMLCIMCLREHYWSIHLYEITLADHPSARLLFSFIVTTTCT